MSELVTVMISDLFEAHLKQTLDNLTDTAEGPIELLVQCDDTGDGMRALLNRMAADATGKYLFKLDGHCLMTPGWDTRLKEVCDREQDMAVCRIRELRTTPQLEMTEKGFGFVTLLPDLAILAVGDFTLDDPDIAETCASIGCGWMIQKSRYLQLEGCDESLGRYGNLGAEWALKIWLSGGRTLVPRDVLCGHLFRKQRVNGVGEKTMLRARAELGARFQRGDGPEQNRPLAWLADHFELAKTKHSVHPVGDPLTAPAGSF